MTGEPSAPEVPAGVMEEPQASLVFQPAARKLGGKFRGGRTRKQKPDRVTWDEVTIAEHDKERGTRQKIDEPDTPFVRSPQADSDQERIPASSDDERRPHLPDAIKMLPPSDLEQLGVGSLERDAKPPTGGPEIEAANLADRLNDLVRQGKEARRRFSVESGEEADVELSRPSSTCSSRSSSAAADRRLHLPVAGAAEKIRPERRISLPDEATPKQSSDVFKARRQQHYNEFAAIQAMKHRSGETTPDESDSSGAEPSALQTNTNTNINQTIPKEVVTRPRGSTGSAAGSERGGAGSGAASPRPDPDADRDLKERQEMKERERGVSFSEGESGGDSQREDFRQARQLHYSGEYRPEVQSAAAAVGSLETNTNTNLNAGSMPLQSAAAAERPANPMEAGRPPVQFGVGAEPTGGVGASSDDFRARRQQHYNEVAALRNMPPPSDDEEEETSDEELVSPSASAQGAAPPADAERRAAPAPCAGNPANPMEPREPSVAFAAPGEPVSPVVTGTGQRLDQEAGWRNKRDAHYTNMAAALRNMPPPSDDEDDSDDD